MAHKDRKHNAKPTQQDKDKKKEENKKICRK